MSGFCVANAPGSVTDVRYTVAGPGSVSVTWTPPTNNGGAPITSYNVVAFDPLATMSFAIRSVVSPPALFTGLPVGQSMFFSVRAVNSAGQSAPIGGGLITLTQ